MSETTPCASTIATVCAHNCKGEQINIPVKDFPAYVGVDIAAPEARALKAKGQQLQMQVDTINQKIDRVNAMATNPEDKGIKQRLDDSEENIENLKEEGKQRDAVIGEIGDNITMLKNWSIRQDEKMEKLNKKVITDPIHYNFEEWVENVYAAQADAITNRYSEGDIYINTNQDVASTNTTYINIRKPGATTPPSANDWQEIYSPSAADMLTILGIDPVKVNHPGKHNWVISIDPNRLADMLANLRTLDLSKVDVTLGEVYFNPVFKEDAVIEQNLSVGDTLTVPKAEINTANIDRACIKEMVCDTKFTGNPTFDEVTITNKLDVGNVDIKGNLNVTKGNIHLGGNSVVVPIIEGDTHFHDHVYAPNITVENKVEMKNLHVTRDTYIKGNIVFDGPITYKDANDAASEPVCVDNLYKNLFRPSWGIFNMEGNLQGSGEPNGAVAGIGSNAISIFNQAQQAPAHLKAVWSAGNNTTLTWDKSAGWTPGVYLQDFGGELGKVIVVNGSEHDAGIYQVNFNLTVSLRDLSADRMNNIRSVRAGLVFYDKDNVGKGGFILDDKFHPEKDYYEFEWNHTHSFYDDDYPSGSSDTTSQATLRFNSYPYVNTDNGQHPNNPPFKKYVGRSLGQYTFTVSALIPIKSMMYVSPFIKFSSGSLGQGNNYICDITKGEWNTGGLGTLSVHKIANVGVPYEYHCARED